MPSKVEATSPHGFEADDLRGALQAWALRAAVHPIPGLLEAGWRVLVALYQASPDLAECARFWGATCRAADQSLRDTLSLFSDFQALALDPQAACALEGTAFAAEGWTEGLEQHMQELLAAKTEALQRANRALREVDKGRAAFISSYSHELRTPLTAIAGACELLLEDFAPAIIGEPRTYVAMINQSAELIRRLIDDVLDFERLEARRLDLYLEPLEAAEVVQDVAVLMAPLLQEKGIRCEQLISEGLPPFAADPVRIRQILLNLVSNAVKFSPRGGTIRLQVLLEKAVGRKGAFVAFTVQDSGPGVAPEHQKRIFERFRQAPEGHPRGTGLGLPIAKRLVELHGGRLSLKSPPGEGAAFTFTVPVIEADLRETPACGEQENGGSAAMARSPEWSKR
ncbi:HAMP domain-containing histidine kinase [bacterium]|nr:HAMP domain-containing histidine kinase [bacterium]